MQLKYLNFDLETTGTHPDLHGIHQLAGQIIIDGKIKDRFNIRMCPYDDCEYDMDALDVCKITRRDIQKFQREAYAYTEFMKYLRKYVDTHNPKDKYFLMGYFNLHLDNDFLSRFMQRNAIRNNPFGAYFWSGALDVSVLALNHLKKERDNMLDFKLATVAQYLGIKVNKKRLHDGDYDLELTWEIAKKVDMLTDF